MIERTQSDVTQSRGQLHGREVCGGGVSDTHKVEERGQKGLLVHREKVAVAKTDSSGGREMLVNAALRWKANCSIEVTLAGSETSCRSVQYAKAWYPTDCRAEPSANSTSRSCRHK